MTVREFQNKMNNDNFLEYFWTICLLWAAADQITLCVIKHEDTDKQEVGGDKVSRKKKKDVSKTLIVDGM